MPRPRVKIPEYMQLGVFQTYNIPMNSDRRNLTEVDIGGDSSPPKPRTGYPWKTKEHLVSVDLT